MGRGAVIASEAKQSMPQGAIASLLTLLKETNADAVDFLRSSPAPFHSTRSAEGRCGTRNDGATRNWLFARLVVVEEAVKIETIHEAHRAGDVVAYVLQRIPFTVRKHRWRWRSRGAGRGASRLPCRSRQPSPGTKTRDVILHARIIEYRHHHGGIEIDQNVDIAFRALFIAGDRTEARRASRRAPASRPRAP